MMQHTAARSDCKARRIAAVWGWMLLVAWWSAVNAQPEPTAWQAGVAVPHQELSEPLQLQPGLPSGALMVTDIDFRRSNDGGGQVIVGFSAGLMQPNVRADAKGVTIDWPHSVLPERLLRRWSVLDFATPVHTIAAAQNDNGVRVRVEAAGPWEHRVSHGERELVLTIHPKQMQARKDAQAREFSGERLSLNFQNIEVRALLQVIADFTNFNIVTSDAVAGALTLRLKDVPWDQALHIILEAKGLGMKKSGNVLWIAPQEEIDARHQRELEAARKLQELEPLQTRGFQINYAKAEDLKKQLAEHGVGSTATRFLSARGLAIAEPRTNQLFVTETAAKLDEIEQLLKRLDIPVRQVLIEARIVEARDTFGRSLGVKFGGSYSQPRGSIGSGYGVPDRSLPNFNNSGTSAQNPFVNLPAGLSFGGDSAAVAFSIFNAGLSRFLSLELSAMEAEGTGRVISNPRLLTADQNLAVIEQGTEYPYTETAPNGATTVSFKKAVLKLEVVPQITPEGNIMLDLDLNKDSRGETTSQGVAIDTKHIKTRVLVENGGTVVIGGIFETEAMHQVNKVPVLGDIPVMGNFFKSRTHESIKREMLVFITPRMVMDAMVRP